MSLFHMISLEHYYQTPPAYVFDDIKEQAINIWKTYDDTYGYASGKIAIVNNVQNAKDNAWYIVGMFDSNNQAKLIKALKEETIEYIRSISK